MLRGQNREKIRALAVLADSFNFSYFLSGLKPLQLDRQLPAQNGILLPPCCAFPKASSPTGGRYYKSLVSRPRVFVRSSGLPFPPPGHCANVRDGLVKRLHPLALPARLRPHNDNGEAFAADGTASFVPKRLYAGPIQATARPHGASAAVLDASPSPARGGARSALR